MASFYRNILEFCFQSVLNFKCNERSVKFRVNYQKELSSELELFRNATRGMFIFNVY